MWTVFAASTLPAEQVIKLQNLQNMCSNLHKNYCRRCCRQFLVECFQQRWRTNHPPRWPEPRCFWDEEPPNSGTKGQTGAETSEIGSKASLRQHKGTFVIFNSTGLPEGTELESPLRHPTLVWVVFQPLSSMMSAEALWVKFIIGGVWCTATNGARFDGKENWDGTNGFSKKCNTKGLHDKTFELGML